MDAYVGTIVETWLSTEIGEQEIAPPNNVRTKKNRPGRASAIATVLREYTSFWHMADLPGVESLRLESH